MVLEKLIDEKKKKLKIKSGNKLNECLGYDKNVMIVFVVL